MIFVVLFMNLQLYPHFSQQVVRLSLLTTHQPFSVMKKDIFYFLSIIIDKIAIFAAVIKHGRQWRY